MGPEGDPAAPWIHLYAVSALLFIVVPRAVLAVLASRRLRAVTADVPLDLDAEYFRDLLRRARAVSPEKLEATVRGAARDECRRFTDRLCAYVCDELYDGRIVPRLREFREQGGRLADLNETLKHECEQFGSQLSLELQRAQQDLEHALVGHVRRLLGDASLPPPRALGGVVARLDDARPASPPTSATASARTSAPSSPAWSRPPSRWWWGRSAAASGNRSASRCSSASCTRGPSGG
jgi:hypothetical protein